MEPKQSAPNLSPERIPSLSYEAPSDQKTGFEQAPGRSMERRESAPATSEQTQVPAQSGAVLPLVPMPGASTASDGSQLPVDDNPLVAGDDDLIEKEWVDKAKKIIAQTKDDPYRREMEINRLQVDYLKKRYGKQLGEVK